MSDKLLCCASICERVHDRVSQILEHACVAPVAETRVSAWSVAASCVCCTAGCHSHALVDVNGAILPLIPALSHCLDTHQESLKNLIQQIR